MTRCIPNSSSRNGSHLHHARYRMLEIVVVMAFRNRRIHIQFSCRCSRSLHRGHLTTTPDGAADCQFPERKKGRHLESVWQQENRNTFLSILLWNFLSLRSFPVVFAIDTCTDNPSSERRVKIQGKWQYRFPMWSNGNWLMDDRTFPFDDALLPTGGILSGICIPTAVLFVVFLATSKWRKLESRWYTSHLSVNASGVPPHDWSSSGQSPVVRRKEDRTTMKIYGVLLTRAGMDQGSRVGT